MTKIYFKENLARLRKNNKLSQDQVGKIVGKSHNAIYKWENGMTEPTLMDVAILSEYFDIPVDVLLFTDISLEYPPTISQRILDDYKTLDKSDQEVVNNMIKALKK